MSRQPFFEKAEVFLSRVSSATPRLTALLSGKRFSPRPSFAPSTRLPPLDGELEAERRYLYVLPVLFLEYLALSLTRALLPGLMNVTFGDYTYHVLGIVETVKGILAFVACPLFGRLSDVVGRRTGLLLTVLGTTMPVTALAITGNMWVFVVAQGLSGLFASTFTITFAYIADLVAKERRSSAYGLALATFGLSYCIGPIAGGFLGDRLSMRAVFSTSVLLAAFTVAYILFLLPESRPGNRLQAIRFFPISEEYLPNQWSPFSILEVFNGDKLLLSLSKVVFLYYSGVWAMVSTLMVHIQRTFHADQVTLGEIMSVFGLCTMLSEGLLVRVSVPYFGEKASMQIGLAAFALQCVFVTFARHVNDIFFALLFSTLANLVYPAVSSLVSRSVAPSKLGEALGAMNGIRALTEGFGPLLFGLLMYATQKTSLPGAPYLLAAAFSLAALFMSQRLPNDCELEIERQRLQREGSEETEGLLAGHEERDTGHMMTTIPTLGAPGAADEERGAATGEARAGGAVEGDSLALASLNEAQRQRGEEGDSVGLSLSESGGEGDGEGGGGGLKREALQSERILTV